MALELRLENHDETIEISSYLPTGWLRERGARGFGVVPRKLNMKPSVSGGARSKGMRRGTRDIDLPITFLGEGRTEAQAAIRKLVRLLNNDDGSFATLYAKSDDGVELYTTVELSGGGDHQYGSDVTTGTYVRWPITLTSTSPYWTRLEPVTYTLRNTNPGRGLLPKLVNLKLSSSQTIGSFTVENPGDVDAQPVWSITGPGDSFTAVRGDGASFAYIDNLGIAETIIVDTLKKTVVDAATGDNRYGGMGFAPKFFTLPPGMSTVDLVLENATSGSVVSFYFKPRFEVIL